MRGRRWIDRKAAGEAVSDRAITNHLLLTTSVNFLILPSAFFLSAIRVTFVKELPKTATGKILKYVLSATACDHSAVSCIGRQMLRRDAENFVG